MTVKHSKMRLSPLLDFKDSSRRHKTGDGKNAKSWKLLIGTSLAVMRPVVLVKIELDYREKMILKQFSGF